MNPIVLSGSTGAVLKSQVPTAPAITYYGGGGGGNSTTIINNTYSFGTVENFTSTGIANFNIANFSGGVTFASSVSFSTLPLFPLSYGSLMMGGMANTTTGLSIGNTGEVLTIIGGAPTWMNIDGSYPVSSIFGRTGSVMVQIGDYNSDQVTEGIANLYYTQSRFDAAFTAKSTSDLSEGSNLYFTDLRAQNSLSGIITGINASIGTLSGQVSTNIADITSLSGSLVSLMVVVNTLSGSLASLSNTVTSLSGVASQNTTDISSLSGELITTNSILSSLSGTVSMLSMVVSTLSSNLSNLTTTVSTLSGGLATTNANLASLSNTVSTLSGNLSTLGNTVMSLSGIVDTIIADISTFSGGLSTTNGSLSTLSGVVASNFNTLSGGLATTNATLMNLSGSVSVLANTLTILSGTVNTVIMNIAALSGVVSQNITDISSLSGELILTKVNLLSLSGVVATKISLTSLSASGPLSYNSGTGLFSLAIANTSTTGALTGADWTTFNNKQGTLSILSPSNGLSLVGAGLSIGLASTSTTGALSIGDWNTFNNKINLTSLSTTGSYLSYNNTTGAFGFTGTTTNFIEGTNLYFTNARAQNAFSGSVAGLQSQINTLSGSLVSLTSTINNLSGSLASLSGSVSTLNSQILSLSGQTATNTTNIATNTTNISTNTANISTLSGVANSLANTVNTVSGALNMLTTTVNTLSGNLASLSGQTATNIASINALSGSLASLTNTVNTLSGTVTNIIDTVNTLSGSLATTNSNLATTNSNLATATGNIATLSGQTATNTTNIATNTANIASLSGSLVSLSGQVSTLNSQVSTLSGQVATLQSQSHAPVTLGTTNGLSLTGQQISLALGSTATVGALSASDWNTFNAKIGSMNGLTGSFQTFAIGIAGNDFNIISSGSVHTFNIPDASLTARGLVSTGAQTFAGSKIFAVAPTLSGFMQGSMLFAETGGIIAQDNTNFFYDLANSRIGIGTNTPSTALTINSKQIGTGGLRFTQLTNTSTGISANGKALTLDGSGNIVLANMAYGADVIVSKTTALTAAMSNTAQVVIFNSETQDINNGHDNTTGIYTTSAGAADTYTVEAQLGFTIANMLARTPCVAIRRSGVVMVSSCNSDYNDTGGGTTASRNSVAVSATLTLTAGQTVDITTFTDTNPTVGTVPTFSTGAGTNYLVIKRVGNAPFVTSDVRLKKNIESFTGGLEDILSINTVAFEYNGMSKNALNDGTKHIGIIAQEVQSGSLGKWAISTGPDGYLRYDPSAVIYSLVNSIKALDKKKANMSGSGIILGGATANVLAPDMTNINTTLTDLSSQISLLSGALSEYYTRISAIEQAQVIIGSSSGNTNTIIPANSTAISSEDQSALDMILGTAENLIIQGKTIFLETVSFAQAVIFEKAVIFRSLVTFEDRVIFGDRDMGGSSRIAAGRMLSHVAFDRPYDETPVVTISPVDHYMSAKVTNLSRFGFDIEIASSISVGLKFNWLAVLVKGGVPNHGVESLANPDTPPSLPELPVDTPPSSTPVVSGEVDMPIIVSSSGSSPESSSGVSTTTLSSVEVVDTPPPLDIILAETGSQDTLASDATDIESASGNTGF